MKIQPNSSVPVFRQIVAEIQSAIAAGIYREGEAIPSARELALMLNVNPNTVQKAFDELDLLGVIETRRGIGKFVTRGALQSASKGARQEVLETFVEGVRIANAAGLSRKEVDHLYANTAKKIKERVNR